MSWNTIARVDPVANTCPADGVRVSLRGMGKDGAGTRGYLAIQIGADLARRAGFATESVSVRLMLGSDNNAGRLAVVLDPTGGFVAKGKPGKGYRIAMGLRSAAQAGLATEFPGFDRPGIEVIKPVNGQPRMFSFLLTRQALADQ
ncbi:hypothetical protein GO308_09750 [Sphingomonas sp. SFZ2018-12]|uniref:hypothetical protein n=1 Tax=Sphingomonas sp. SFZ2018-12 TaxID=2683197 RepID=UPI001F0F1FC5|nr:hypothetical protein [Sphingomonas sp. SFZ2018-12]MCH4893392.1 hypothetical protein [Sphingomonas sp. SFZ2018-12]